MDKIEYCNTQIRSWADVLTPDRSKTRISSKCSKSFPYYGILECYRSLGKHFVPSTVLLELANIYEYLRNQNIEMEYINEDSDYDSHKLLKDFLGVCLDKHLRVYEYKSYIALPIFLDNSLPPRCNAGAAILSRMTLLKALLYDDYAFEARSFLGEESYTQDRRNNSVIIQRTSNIVRALVSLNNLLASFYPDNPSEQIALRLLEDCHREAVDANALSRGLAIVEILRKGVAYEFSAPLNLLLDLSMLPVFVNHEEYNFIRMLQMFEVMFSAVIMGLQNTINSIYDNRIQHATHCLKLLRTIFGVDVHLFRILTTMQREDFHIFRQYTEGASAIQSPQFKMVEVLIGKPTAARRESPAFKFVPEIRIFLERTGLNLEQVLNERYAQNDCGIDIESIRSSDDLELLQNINMLDNAILAWKKRHFGIACHMIGAIKGTGDTDGVDYLAKFKEELFFPSLNRILKEPNLAVTN